MIESKLSEIVSTNIKNLIVEYGLTQKQLANIAGVSESTVGKWVLRKSYPRMSAIESMSDYFNIKYSYFLEDKNLKGE